MQQLLLYTTQQPEALATDVAGDSSPFCVVVQLSHGGLLNGGGRPKAGLGTLLDRGRHVALSDIEAHLPHELPQVHVCLLEQRMTGVLKLLQHLCISHSDAQECGAACCTVVLH